MKKININENVISKAYGRNANGERNKGKSEVREKFGRRV